jgi:fructose-1,6-bisphosphatase/inositol monophosphatase family enzyme
LEKEVIPVDFRLYNLAGNPMMVRLAEGRVHAVVDINGQDLYDVVPGAYIAQKAGAHWGDLEGNEITEEYLREKYLSRSAHDPMKYILATSEALYKELLAHLR